MHESDPSKSIFVDLILCRGYVDVWGRFVQYRRAHAEDSVGLIVVSSEGMSKVMTFVLLKWPYRLHHSCVLKLIFFFVNFVELHNLNHFEKSMVMHYMLLWSAYSDCTVLSFYLTLSLLLEAWSKLVCFCKTTGDRWWLWQWQIQT